MQKDRLQGEEAAAIEKRRVADAVLKVRALYSVLNCNQISVSNCKQLTCFAPPAPLLSVAAIVVRCARVRQSCCCRRDVLCFSHCTIVTLHAAGDDGRLFGSVSAEEIAAAIKVPLTPRRSVLNAPTSFCVYCCFVWIVVSCRPFIIVLMSSCL